MILLMLILMILLAVKCNAATETDTEADNTEYSVSSEESGIPDNTETVVPEEINSYSLEKLIVYTLTNHEEMMKMQKTIVVLLIAEMFLQIIIAGLIAGYMIINWLKGW